jgi:hypothetical protein
VKEFTGKEKQQDGKVRKIGQENGYEYYESGSARLPFRGAARKD